MWPGLTLKYMGKQFYCQKEGRFLPNNKSRRSSSYGFPICIEVVLQISCQITRFAIIIRL